MITKKQIFILLILFFALKSIFSQKKPVDYVNPFIGASTNIDKAGAYHGLGKTFPGATTPFGLVQLSPNTVTGGDNGSGYSYEHLSIEGFAFTQMSGVGWYGDLGNFLVIPTNGVLKTFSGRLDAPDKGYRSRYLKEDEVAEAGYYSVKLSDYNIKVEATAAPHSGILCFTFSEHQQSRIQIDLARRVGGTSTRQYYKLIDDHTIQGWMDCTPKGGGWGNGDGDPNYRVYFYAQFSKPIKNYGVWTVDFDSIKNRKREFIESDLFEKMVMNAKIIPLCKEIEGDHIGFYSEFPTKNNEQVYLKVGISFVSIEGARQNLQSEIVDFDFQKVRIRTHELWNDYLSKIIIQGGTEEEKTIFYTALYHTMIDPRCFTDINGNYPGGDQQSHNTTKFVKRTIFSGWDVYRSQFPLQTIINPEVVNDMINSLIELADESKNQYLERWEFLNAYSGCMLGNPAVNIIVEAYNKGIRKFDVEKAYKFSKNSCELNGNEKWGHSKSISTTLENSYSEYCLSLFADSLGYKNEATKYRDLSKSYQHIFDTTVQWFRPKDEFNNWREWPAEGRLTQGYGCAESNPYQQGWFVPHDMNGFVSLIGGKDEAIRDLTLFFDSVPQNMMWNNYYNHSNEPVHFVPFIFNQLGVPWLTQKWVREILFRAYKNSVEGLVGNEDVGQMSAWYVLAATGIHPSCPADTKYEICSPIFDYIEYQLDTNYSFSKKFIIKTYNNSKENIYIQRVLLNGQDYENSFITHSDIINGSVLEIYLGPSPNKNWGINRQN